MAVTNIRVDYEVFPSTKRAVHTSLMPHDQFVDAHGLHDVSTDFEHGRSADSISIRLPGQAHTFAVGDTLNVRNIGGVGLITARIDAIRMMDTTQFTQADYDALAITDIEAHNKGWGAVFAGRAWWFDITPIDPDQPYG
jgi:CRISPR/Cas system type I-B associated protein Csh2 (Cas7 group RAMP superfamily)